MQERDLGPGSHVRTWASHRRRLAKAQLRSHACGCSFCLVSAKSVVRQMQKCKQDLLDQQPPRGWGASGGRLIHPLKSLSVFHSHEKLLP